MCYHIIKQSHKVHRNAQENYLPDKNINRNSRVLTGLSVGWMTSHKRGKSSNTSVALLRLDRVLGTTSANNELIVFWYFDNFVWNWDTSNVINAIEEIHTLFNAINNHSSLEKLLQSEKFNLVKNTKRTISNKLNRMKTYILMPISCIFCIC